MTSAGQHTAQTWQAEGCTLVRFDLVPGVPLALNSVLHDEVQILAFEGSAWTSRQNGRHYSESAGCVVLREAGQVYSTRMDHIDASGSVCREIRIPVACVDRLREYLRGYVPAIDFRHPVLTAPHLAQQLSATHAAMTSQDPLAASSALTDLIVALAATTAGLAPRLPKQVCSRRNRQIIDYLRAHFDQKIGLAELAELTQMNPYVLLRQFRAEIGVSPHAYLQAWRLCRARALMSEGIPLAEVAVMCGYTDQSHFTRQFKQRFGLTPRQYPRAA